MSELNSLIFAKLTDEQRDQETALIRHECRDFDAPNLMLTIQMYLDRLSSGKLNKDEMVTAMRRMAIVRKMLVERG